jgi:hypothetical protein
VQLLFYDKSQRKKTVKSFTGVNSMKFFIKMTTTAVLLLFLSSCAQQQQLIKKDTPSPAPAPAPSNVETSFLGIAFNQFLEHIDYDDIQMVEGCCWGIKLNDELLLVLYDKKGLSDLIVRNFEIYSPNITLNKKIRTGMTIDSLLGLFPDIELLIDEDDDKMEYFSPPALTTYKPDGSLDTIVAIEVESGTGKPLSINADYPTRQFGKKGYISKISVFKW